MNGLQQLINQLCPNGVEKKPLWQLTAWDKHFNGVDKSMQKKVIPYKYYLSEEFNAVEKDDGDVLYIATGVSDKKRYTTEELAGDYLAEGEIVCIPWGGTPNVKYHKGKFVTGDNRIATSIDTNILSNKFLYYWMSCNIKDIELLYRGAGIKHPSMKGVLSLQIPLPPLAIQSRIVEILDHFTNLTANLTAELALRRKQFEHFREKLLSLDGVEGVEMKTLGEVGSFYNGVTGKSKKDFENGNAKFISYKNVFTNSKMNVDVDDTIQIYEGEKQNTLQYGDVIFTTSSETPDESGMSSVLTTRTKEKLYLNSFCFGFRFNNLESISPDFYSYIFRSEPLRKQIVKCANGVTRYNISKESFAKVKIPIPPLAVQQTIVEQLDKFTALIQNIENELALRQKQYEYYREKLLSFPSPSL